MGTYDHGFVSSVVKRAGVSLPLVAVETGTCLGYSTRILAGLYSFVHTIELSETLYDRAVQAFIDEGLDNVTCWCGDSAVKLKELIQEEVEIQRPCLFYLDAHWSGDRTVDWSRSEWQGYHHMGRRVDTAHRGSSGLTPSSEEQVPLAEELTLIVDRFPYECVVYVDDFERFDAFGDGRTEGGFVGNDWSHLSVRKLRKIVAERLAGDGGGWYESRDGKQLAITLKAK